MRLGAVILPEHPWREGRTIWRRVEELGLDHAWTYDHLAWRDLRDGPWFGTTPTLAAAASVTDRIRLGPMVASPNFRHPVVLARDLVALDDISDGRITLGIGAGGTGWDATMLGQPQLTPVDRADRFDEFVTLTDRLLRDDGPVDADGRWFAAVDVPMAPGCVQSPRIPFAIAATGRRGMALAARYAATWVTNGARQYDAALDAAAGARVVAEQSARLDEACAAEGRDPASLHRLVLTGFQLDPGLGSTEQFRDLLGTYAEVGVTDLVVHWPRPSEPFAGDPDRVAEILGAAAGAPA